MVRKYTRKTLPQDSDALSRAMQAVEIGMSLRAAARQSNVGYMSLQRRLANAVGHETSPASGQMPSTSAAAEPLPSTSAAAEPIPRFAYNDSTISESGATY